MSDLNLQYILANLLIARVKAEDAPASSDQHWCSAIEELFKLIPDYAPTDPELMYELKYALLNQEVLYGRMSADDAIAELDEYEAAAQAVSFVPPQYREAFDRDRLNRWVEQEPFEPFKGFEKQ